MECFRDVEVGNLPGGKHRHHVCRHHRQDACCSHIVHGRAEGYRSIGTQPLVRAEHAEGPVPLALSVAAQYQLLRQRLLLLQLRQVHEVDRLIVLVHVHVVTQILPRRCRAEQPFACLVTDVQTRIQHLALVAVHHCCRRVFHGVGISVVQTIRECILARPLVVGRHVHRQLLGWLIHKAHLSTSFQQLVVPLVQRLVLEESTLTVPEASCREGELL